MSSMLCPNINDLTRPETANNNVVNKMYSRTCFGDYPSGQSKFSRMKGGSAKRGFIVYQLCSAYGKVVGDDGC